MEELTFSQGSVEPSIHCHGTSMVKCQGACNRPSVTLWGPLDSRSAHHCHHLLSTQFHPLSVLIKLLNHAVEVVIPHFSFSPSAAILPWSLVIPSSRGIGWPWHAIFSRPRMHPSLQ